MLKKSYLLLGSALVFAAPFTSSIYAQDTGVVEPEAVSQLEEPPPAINVSEDELVELLGYLTALGGGVHMLQLDEAGVNAFASGLNQAIMGELDITKVPQAEAEAAFAQAQARAEASQPKAEPAGGCGHDHGSEEGGEHKEAAETAQVELPEISAESLEIVGAAVYMQSGLGRLGFGPENAELIRKGFIAGAKVSEPSAEMQAKMPAFQEFIQARMMKAQEAAQAEAAKAGEVNRVAGAAFVEALKGEDDTIQAADSGLHYKVISEGEGEKPTMSDSVLVHYKGTRIDGTVFDSSYDRGDPATFPLNGVVPGFGEGLTKVAPGGKITLYIPSNLGYGDSPRPGGAIQAGDTLIFECELIEVNPGE